MFAFFGEVSGFFEAIGNFLENVFESLFTAVSIMMTSTTFITMLSSYVPAILSASIIIFIVVYTVKLLAGR